MADLSGIESLTGLKHNIVIDEEAFDRAVEEMKALEDDVRKLEKDVLEMMDLLREGFNTPAGRKFINACFSYVYNPVYMQRKVISQIYENLLTAKQGYRSIFADYKNLVDYMSK